MFIARAVVEAGRSLAAPRCFFEFRDAALALLLKGYDVKHRWRRLRVRGFEPSPLNIKYGVRFSRNWTN
jgi:hypothetical protein